MASNKCCLSVRRGIFSLKRVIFPAASGSNALTGTFDFSEKIESIINHNSSIWPITHFKTSVYFEVCTIDTN